MARQASRHRGYGKLLDAWVPPEGAGQPVGCLATSFTFSPALFEEECLARFLQLESDPAADGIAYVLEREEKMAQLQCAAALVDQHHCQGARSLRWDLLPVRPAGGILHAKVSVLVWTEALRLIVASANLTEDGYRRNREVFGVLDYHEGSHAPVGCLAEIIDFLGAIVGLTAAAPASDAAASRCLGLLEHVRRTASGWGSEQPDARRQPVAVSAVLVGPGHSDALTQLAALLPSGRPADSAWVCSPFFDPPSRRKSVIFLTHGAFSNELSDKWVMLALIRQALHGRHGMGELRQRLSRVLGELLWMRWVERNGQTVWSELLASDPGQWLRVLQRWDVDPEGDGDSATDDDPVPGPVARALRELRAADTREVFEALQRLPQRASKHRQQRIDEARKAIRERVRALWWQCVAGLELKLPLLVLDEAHHLKNPNTRLAGLFHLPEAQEDCDELSRGAFGGVFERMLFLTATPFQLGHGELCSVLERFAGISWEGLRAPRLSRSEFAGQLLRLRASLDKAQEAAVALDAAWGHLTAQDLVLADQPGTDVLQWWTALVRGDELTDRGEGIRRCYLRVEAGMREAEEQLRPWVIRHLRPRKLPPPNEQVERRRRVSGAGIRTGTDGASQEGLALDQGSLLPFLLAARAVACTPETRPVFAEGLASSYEAFLQTRRGNCDAGLDTDDDGGGLATDADPAAQWYLEQLATHLPIAEPGVSASHPKMAATVERALQLWTTGEKVVVFCHYVATGRALRQGLSAAIDEEITRRGCERIGCDPTAAKAQLERIGQRFFDTDSPVRRGCDAASARMIGQFPVLADYTDELQQVVRRYLRTPSFLTRFVPIEGGELRPDAIARALDTRDLSGMSLRDVLMGFFRFLAETCGAVDRARYVEAAGRIQTGAHTGADVAASVIGEDTEGTVAEDLLPNVRLVNGRTQSETRQRLMLAFNTPFYPELLVASSVMSEGVDLHLHCRHVIHQDLCWNPTTLEQRTGRVDRIGAKAERCGQPIWVYLPYVAQTQDEKMYRVVMDRERWFSVVMGEDYRLDPRTVERLASRLPFPESAARALAFRLGVVA